MIREFDLQYSEAPKSMNAGGGGSRQHWSVAHAEKRRWAGIYTTLLLTAKVPRGMEFCRVGATIRWSRKNGADSTNYLASVVKPLADVLAPPLYLYSWGKNHTRVTTPNVAPRWLPNDTDEYFKFTGVEFEYPKPWPFTDPRVKAEIVIHLEARYPDAPASRTSV